MAPPGAASAKTTSEPCAACGHRPGEPLPIGRIIRMAREARGWSGEELLSRAGHEWDGPALYRFERQGKKLPPQAPSLCKALGIQLWPVAGGNWQGVVATADPPFSETSP